MRLKALLLCTTMLIPSQSNAAVVTAFIAGFTGAATATATAGILGGAIGAAATVGTFLGQTVLGGILLNVGISAALNALNKPKAPSISDARFNSRLADAVRWQMGGLVSVGGAVGSFGEHDADGNFWYIVAHGDAEMIGLQTYYFDGIELTLSDGTDGFTAGDVLTDDFCLKEDGTQYEGDGVRVPYFRIYTVTPDGGDAYGAIPNLYGVKPTDFTDAFPNLPSDFRLTGTCYSIIRCGAVKPEHYNTLMRWRGSIGLGEPSVAVVSKFSRMYDPRNLGHDVNDPKTWTGSPGNPAIVWAWWRMNQFGRNRPANEINWTKVAEQANICDETVLDRSGESIPRYSCGVAFPDNKPRQEAEAEILLTCDGFVVYDDDGKAWPSVGKYVAPSLTFSAARDIISAQTQIVDDGETAIDGVVVNYISPQHGYTKQPSAPWVNTAYYDGTSAPNYLSVDILGIQDHNQAVRMAKSIGLRSASSKRAGVVTSIKGVLAKGVRTIGLDWDTQFSGDFEIVTPVKEDSQGLTTSFALVPMQTDRYDLNEGEEGQPPQPATALDIDNTIAAAVNVDVTAQPVEGSTGAAVRFEATFDAPTRVDRVYRFRYAPTGQTVYEYFITDMDELFAYSAIVQDGVDYDVSWQTVTAGGRASDWSGVETLTATANVTPPADLIAFSALGGAGQVTLDYTTADDPNQYKVRIYQGATATFSAATLVETYYTGRDLTKTKILTGLAAGSFYFWAVPTNGSNKEGTPSGPELETIT